MKDFELLAERWEKRAADIMVEYEKSTVTYKKINLYLAYQIWSEAALELQDKIDNINS